MARPSSIALLPDAVREAVDRAIREGRLTVDGLVALVNGAGHQVSRSAMGRHRKVSAERLAKYRETQEIAREWMAQMRADPDGDIGQLLAEMLKTLAFRTQMEMQEEGAAPDAKSLSMLARALKDLGSTDKLKAAMRRELEEAARAQAAEAAVRHGREAGLSGARLQRLRAEVLGVRPAGAEGAEARA
jgi:hypothetical protein